MDFEVKKLLNYENKLESDPQKRQFYDFATKNVACFGSEKSGGN